MRVVAAPRKHSTELQQRATRMAMDARKDPESARGAIKRVADQLRFTLKRPHDSGSWEPPVNARPVRGHDE